jgi:CobQ-like glutamine amidotransferase family enzyme
MTQAYKQPLTQPLTLTLGHLYPDQLNLYGDRGNIITFRRRCEMRGIQLRVVGLGIGDALAPDEYDMLFIGGGQDKEQAPVAQDLYEIKGIGLWAAIEDNMPVLAVCGGYQLLAHYYRPAQGPDMRGLGVFDAWTIQKDPPGPRCIGNIAISWNGQTLVGFENHSGRTYLGTAQPLGKVLKGYGNNAEDRTEGAVYRNTFGTYLHGSLLPKNPHFADHFIKLALQHKYGPDLDSDLDFDGLDGASPSAASNDKQQPSTTTLTSELDALITPLDDKLEWEAHSYVLERMGLHKAAAITQRRY